MPVIKINVTRPTALGPRPATGSMLWEPTRRRQDNTTIKLPLPFYVHLIGGNATVTVDATTPEWVWKVTELFDHTDPVTHYYSVHGSTDYPLLTKIDPATLDLEQQPEKLWWDAFRNLQLPSFTLPEWLTRDALRSLVENNNAGIQTRLEKYLAGLPEYTDPYTTAALEAKLPERLSTTALNATIAKSVAPRIAQALMQQPLTGRSLAVNPPTVAHATAATIDTPSSYGLASGVVRTLSGLPYLFNNAGDRRWVSAAGALDPNSNLLNNISAWGFEFEMDGNAVEFRWRATPTNNVRMWILIDGHPITEDWTTPTDVTLATGGVYFTKLTFASASRRRVTIFWNDAGLYEILAPQTTAITEPAGNDMPLKVACFGASFTCRNDGTAMYGTRDRMWPWWVARQLGVEVLQAGVSGSGYVTDSTAAPRYATPGRVQALTTWKPDVIIVEGSGNDDNLSASAITEAASAFYATLAAALPDVPVVVIGAMPRGDEGTLIDGRGINLQAVEAAAEAASNVIKFIDPVGYRIGTPAYTSDALYTVGDRCTYRGAVYECVTDILTNTANPLPNYFKVVSWFTGTGSTVDPKGDGNRDVFVGADETHPTVAGQRQFGTNIAREFRAALLEWVSQQ